ncbi:hypothetical protein GCM10009527_080440 [Actinomadura nitritigenes]|uniref:Uncharacterized protein n=1 Tax=Actinomadura nitritigenes TaxID=134602 RepID=A0ABS3QX90_9ACTN|nr:hypothetical protein [Actinomadura nitritigenes]MBO2438377.1 hypothetical protein [Actinomadura nitritigenes]
MTPTAPAPSVPSTDGEPPEKIAVPVLPSAAPQHPGDRLVYSGVRDEPAGRRSHRPRPSGGGRRGLGVHP